MVVVLCVGTIEEDGWTDWDGDGLILADIEAFDMEADAVIDFDTEADDFMEDIEAVGDTEPFDMCADADVDIAVDADAADTVSDMEDITLLLSAKTLTTKDKHTKQAIDFILNFFFWES